MTGGPRPKLQHVGSSIRSDRLAAAFAATSSSYKFYWFLALLDQLPSSKDPIPVERLVRSMIVRAWSTVAQYRLSLGRTDRLQLCVRELQAEADLTGTATRDRLDRALDLWPDLPQWAEELARFVPGRFLGAWFPHVARSHPYDRRGARDVAVAANLAWGTPDEAPYRLVEQHGGQVVEMAPRWTEWLALNEALTRGFAKHRLCAYLQARNPGVPGIVDKLEPPGRRALSTPRRWWAGLIERGGVFGRDIYTGVQLGAEFDVDHFLPWTFVAHDEWWNLAPTIAAVNRSKGDRIPNLERFLPRLANLHAEALALPELPQAMVRGYAEFLRMDVAGATRPSRREVLARYVETMGPLARQAENQGFQGGWAPNT